MINSSCSTANENCMAVKNEVHSGSDKGCPQKDAPGKKKEKKLCNIYTSRRKIPILFNGAQLFEQNSESRL